MRPAFRTVVGVFVGVGVGLVAMSSLASAQGRPTPSGDVTSLRGIGPSHSLPTRAFSGVSFGAPTRIVTGRYAPARSAAQALARVTPPSTEPSAPRCTMPVAPIDPSFTSRMPVVTVDETPDPKLVVKVPPCQPRK